MSNIQFICYIIITIGILIISRFISKRAINLLKNKLIVRTGKEILKNIKRNWFLPVSATAYFCLHSYFSKEYIFSLIIAILCFTIISSQIYSISNFIKMQPIQQNLFSALTAVGICLQGQEAFKTRYLTMININNINYELINIEMLIYIFSYFLMFSGCVFIFICLSYFFVELKKALKNTHLIDDINKKEIIVYIVLITITALFITIVYSKTQAFYGTEYYYDVIYTSDSPALIKTYVWTSINNSQNDIRQPLFAVFAAPFMGLPYLLIRGMGLSNSASAIIIDYVQILILFGANYLLAKSLNLKTSMRISFIVFLSSVYTFSLSSLMIEQYIISYFWLMLCIYFLSQKKYIPQIIIYGAGGTLLTSFAILTAHTESNVIISVKKRISYMIDNLFEFTALVFIFCRFDIIYNIIPILISLAGFTGVSVTAKEKLYQYTAFIRSCFIAPYSDIYLSDSGIIAWRQLPVEFIDIFGICLLIFSLISFFINRNQIVSKIAAGWIVYSIILLLFIGWGTAENGLILYSLYFGWAFYILIFQLFISIACKTKINYLAQTLCIGSSVVLLMYNFSAIINLLKFAEKYYPV